MRKKGGYVYVVMNKNRTVLYIGVTSKIYTRITAHKNGYGSVFTSKYNCTDLVYYEFFPTIVEAIRWEKEFKKWNRAWKLERIQKRNPDFDDLYDELEPTMDI